MDIERKDFIYSKMCSMNMDISSAGYAKLDDNWYLENPIKFNYSRFYFVLDGQGEITVNGIKTILKKGNIYFVPSDTLFSFSCNNYLEKVYFHVNVYCAGTFDLFSSLNKCIVINNQMPLINEIYELYEKSNASDILKIRTHLYSLLCRIAMENQLTANTAVSPFVSEVLEYLNEHFIENPTEEAIAKALYVSRDKLRKIFKNEMNIPLGKYIDNMLLDAAEKELRTTNFSIREISQKYGYCDQFYFSRIFSKKYGVSPQKYRKVT